MTSESRDRLEDQSLEPMEERIFEEAQDLEELEEIEELDELEEENPEGQSVPSWEELLQNNRLESFNLPVLWGEKLDPFQPLFIVNQDMTLHWYNQALLDLYGQKEMEGIHNLSQLLKLPEGHETYQELLLALRKSNQNHHWSHSLDVVIPQWGICHLLLMLLPLPNAQGFSNHFFGIMENHTDHQRRLVFRTFQSLLEASLLKDNDTGNHIRRVNAYSHHLSSQLLRDSSFLFVDRNFVEDISYLAAMHDVGKIGTPDDILNKEGPLEDWEMRIMREHTTNGAYILANYPNPMAKDIAMNHHERWDGSGYPFGRQEEMIPLSARIVALADVYDALRSKRKYKSSWPHDRALEVIREGRGKQFDPFLTDLFLEHHEEYYEIWDKLKDVKSS